MDGKSMKKVDIAAVVSAVSGLSIVDSSEIIDIYFDTIADGIAEDGEVKIMKLGTFIKKRKAERVGRNPKTGKPAVIRARNSVLFHPAKNLKTE
jgi:integration host factor subunit alpha